MAATSSVTTVSDSATAPREARPGGARTSLVSYHQSVTQPKAQNPDDSGAEPDTHGCPNMQGWLMVSQSTGAAFPARCGRLGCWYCCRVNAKKRSLAIAYARPEREITFTLVGDDWQQVRDRMKNARALCRSEVGAFEWVWSVEKNPGGTGHHVHGWQWGAFVPQRFLSGVARKLGMGEVVHVSRLRSVGAASRYGLKGLTYGLKGVLAEKESAGYLDLNGARLTHQSRSFFRGADGCKLPVREAERLAVEVANKGGDPGPWVLMRDA